MRFHNDLTGQNATLVRDMQGYDSGLIAGQAVAVVAGDFQACVQDPAAAALADIVGVTCEDLASTTVNTSGTLYFVKTQLNPLAVYEAQHDPAVANDITVVSSTSTAVTLGTCDDNLAGSWLYCNSGTGIGQLAFIGAASTTVFTLDTTTAFTTTPDSTTNVILIRNPFALNKDLKTTWELLWDDENETGEVIVLENYIQSSSIAYGPLMPRQHHMLEGLNNDGVKFYSDIFFADNVFTGATTMA